MSRELVETGYSSGGEVYQQMFLDGKPEQLDELNEVYDRFSWNGRDFMEIAENSDLEREGKVQTVDGYNWHDGLKQTGSGILGKTPFREEKGEIVVLFPTSFDYDGELQIDRSVGVYAEEGVSEEEATQFVKEVTSAMEEHSPDIQGEPDNSDWLQGRV